MSLPADLPGSCERPPCKSPGRGQGQQRWEARLPALVEGNDFFATPEHAGGGVPGPVASKFVVGIVPKPAFYSLFESLLDQSDATVRVFEPELSQNEAPFL